jgi:hypothetical protein
VLGALPRGRAAIDTPRHPRRIYEGRGKGRECGEIGVAGSGGEASGGSPLARDLRGKDGDTRGTSVDHFLKRGFRQKNTGAFMRGSSDIELDCNLPRPGVLTTNRAPHLLITEGLSGDTVGTGSRLAGQMSWSPPSFLGNASPTPLPTRRRTSLIAWHAPWRWCWERARCHLVAAGLTS